MERRVRGARTVICVLCVLCGLCVPSIDRVAAQSQDASRPSFSEWLAGVKTDALARGIRAEIVDEALATVDEPVPTIIERDRAQAETVLSIEKYIARALTPKVRTKARDMFAQHRALLDEVGARYGVSPRIVVAIWGVESNFGQFVGIRPIVTALATLAYDARRPELFRNELFAALSIVDRGLVSLPELKGS